MNRSKIVAMITGVISLLLAIAYLAIVQLLDFRGEMLPAPTVVEFVPTFIFMAQGRLELPTLGL